MKKSEKVWPLSVATGALGAIAALTLAAPSAHADPEIPIPVPPPPDSLSSRPPEQAIQSRPPRQTIQSRPLPGTAACRSPSPVQSGELASRDHKCSGRTGPGQGSVVSARSLARRADPGHQRARRATSADAATARSQRRAHERTSHRAPGADARGAMPRPDAGRRCPRRYAWGAAARAGMPRRLPGDACRPGGTRTRATPSGTAAAADAVAVRRWRLR